MGRLSEHKLKGCVGLEKIPVTQIRNICLGELHLQTTCAVLRIIRRHKSAESLHLSPDFNFIMTNLEGILIIHALGLFLAKKAIEFQDKFCSSGALFPSD